MGLNPWLLNGLGRITLWRLARNSTEKGAHKERLLGIKVKNKQEF